MVPAHSIESIRKSLLRSFVEEKPVRQRAPDPAVYHWMGPVSSLSIAAERIYLTNKAKLIGILFAPPSHALAKAEVLPNLPYFHRRSGKNVDFFLSGYSAFGHSHNDAVEAAVVDGATWWYSVQALDDIRAEMESATQWHYSGECELLLMNARLDGQTKSVHLDFSSCIVCPLEEMVRVGSISSIRSFFESIFRYAESHDATDPAWGLSDSLGLDKSRSVLKRIVLSLFPKKTGEEVGKLVYFAVRDVSKKGR